MKKLLGVVIITSILVSLSWAGSKPDFKEGQWEVIVETEIPGMPMKMPPTTVSQCITQETMVPQNQQPGQQCELKDVKSSGNTVSWTSICDTPDGKVTGKGRVTYEKEKMNGSMDMQTQGMEMKLVFKGRYTGPCQ